MTAVYITPPVIPFGVFETHHPGVVYREVVVYRGGVVHTVPSVVIKWVIVRHFRLFTTLGW